MTTIVSAKRGQYLWLPAPGNTSFVVVDVIAWEIGEIGVSDRPTPITAGGRVDPMTTPCVLASGAGWLALRENVTLRSSAEAVAYLSQDVA
ncbi:hypothetical protein EDE08_109361 [Bradyrhizobium sp. R2.2-H]|jgi:hypothetical protein|uniref:hypothetical protein n=1 Tax=unclassified Bradyrhizobium TaxID=2631580 RepID=UPI001047D975|nr:MULTISPECIES: hypothetical protein [unclassified Bradyrhizobium]TCU68242.1 hypothetical protein EDE10_10952 [Bradyrhizobium sp. Y-H1]TCU70136.1 hypothetical protein EDE08_109361 [Bradyrhizobium sp. R2.2-H]